MHDIFQLLVGGISMGAIYALLALGLVMIIRAVNMPNIAQCEMAMIGAFISYNLYVVFSLPNEVTSIFPSIF